MPSFKCLTGVAINTKIVRITRKSPHDILTSRLSLCVDDTRDLEEAEDQHLVMARTHLQHLDTLMELYDSKLLALESEFKKELQTIMEEFETSKESMVQKFNMEKEELLDRKSVV